jgi:hypothetical protein
MKGLAKPSLTIQAFEQAADALLHIMFALTEQYGSAALELKKNPDSALQSAALSVQASIKSFIAIERMNNR